LGSRIKREDPSVDSRGREKDGLVKTRIMRERELEGL
jgi:hypothetical protein